MTDSLIQPLGPGDPLRLGGHQLIGVVGQGGMGRVYLGVAPGGGQVAVKVMHPQYAADTAFRERFRREAEVAQRVSGPFTARVLDAGVDERTPWLATEYIPGPTLAQLVTGYGPLPETSVRALAAGLARALSDIHSRRIVHRDLKPANVILSVTGPRVIDFGIARALDGIGMTATHQLLGTFSYMSPEQRNGEAVTGQSDVYSLGAVLIYAATGKAPQQALPLAGAGARGGGPGLGDVPPPLRALIARCLRSDPAQRMTLGQLMAECGQTGTPRLNDWLPHPAAALVRNRTRQQQGNVTTLLKGRAAAGAPAKVPASPQSQPGAAAQAQPGGAGRRGPRLRYRAMSARMALASGRWPAVSPAGLRRWSRLAVLACAVTMTEAVSHSALVQGRGYDPAQWLTATQHVHAAVSQFASWLPDPVAAWTQAAASPAGTGDRLAALSCLLAVLTAVARRTRRARAHKLLVKAGATFAACLLLALLALRLLQTAFGPLLYVAVYLRWWALAPLAVTALAARQLAGPVR